jgi:putative N-acetyltransferase (TIGR04045 family)
MYQVAFRDEVPDAIGEVIAGTPRLALVRPPAWTIEPADHAEDLAGYHRLRHAVFVESQGLFDGHDRDSHDDDPRTVVLVARAADGEVLGGVRLYPVTEGRDLGWWRGGRLVVRPRAPLALGAALVRAACEYAVATGVLRFEAEVQTRNLRFFSRLGWMPLQLPAQRPDHVWMRYPIDRIAALAAATKNPLGDLLRDLAPGGDGFIGDDGAPVPGTDLVAACDAILPAMVERDPWWAGWCSVLVNVNDLAAMGARPVGLLDAVGAADADAAAPVLAGMRAAAERYGVPILGGHTTFGVAASLAVTALGRTEHPLPGGGGRPGHEVALTVDLGGAWRPGYGARQWDSTSTRTAAELQAMLAAPAAAGPAACKDVSMAGIVGTLGMLAEASGCGAALDVAAVPRPAGASMGDWLTCFPGFAMLTAAPAGSEAPSAAPAVSAVCGELVHRPGVLLRWPDGTTTTAVPGAVTGLGPAGEPRPENT